MCSPVAALKISQRSQLWSWSWSLKSWVITHNVLQHHWVPAWQEYDMLSYVWTPRWERKFFFQAPASECLTGFWVCWSWTGVKWSCAHVEWRRFAASCEIYTRTHFTSWQNNTQVKRVHWLITHSVLVWKFTSHLTCLFQVFFKGWWWFAYNLWQLITRNVGNPSRNVTLFMPIWRTRRWTEPCTFQQLQLWNVNIWQQNDDHLWSLCCYMLLFFL